MRWGTPLLTFIKRACTAAVLVAFLLLFFSPLKNVAHASLSTTPNTSTWITDGQVWTMYQDGTTLYLGGNFEYIGPQTGHFAQVDTTTGQSSTTFPRITGTGWYTSTVNTAVSDGSGGWYVGGNFTNSGTLTRNNILHILSGGTVDTNFNPNANGEVRALALSGSTLYVGGDFTTIGGQTRNKIAALDTTTGNASSWNPNAGSTVRALAVDGAGTTIYAGGDFTTIGGQTRNRIAALDTAGLATSLNPNANNSVYTLLLNGTDLYAGGNFTTMSGGTHTHLARIDTTFGTDAGFVCAAGGSTVYGLTISGTTLYIGGDIGSVCGSARNYIGAMDTVTGLTSAFNPNANGPVYGVAISGSTVYATGRFVTIGGQTRRNLAALNSSNGTATSWVSHTAGGGLTGSDGRVVAVSGSNVYAGGYYKSVGGLERRYVAALDTTTGQPTSWDGGFTTGSVYSIAKSGNTLYVGGNFLTLSGVARNRIGALDATTGSATTWNPGADGTIYSLIFSASGTTLYAGGGYANIGGSARNNIAELNTAASTATSWNPNITGSNVHSLLLSGTTLYAGGNFTTINGATTRNGMAAIDTGTGTATSFNPNFGTTPSGRTVYSLALSDTTLYAGGYFNTVGGQTRKGVAAIDTTSGTPTSFDPNVNTNDVEAIALSGTTLYIGGYFASIGGQTRNTVGAVDTSTGLPTSWNPGPSPGNGDVWSLSVLGTTLYIGGEFLHIDGDATMDFAQFDEVGAPTPTPSPSPSPSASASPAATTTSTPTPTPSTSSTAEPTATPTKKKAKTASASAATPNPTPEPIPSATVSTPEPVASPVTPVEASLYCPEGFWNKVVKLIIDREGYRNCGYSALIPPASPAVMATVSVSTGVLGFFAYGISLLAISTIFGQISFNVLSWRKKRRTWGRVVSAITNEGIPGAGVMLYDPAKYNRLIDQTTSDKQGRFGFFALPGNYIIRVVKAGYTFPSNLQSNGYHGQAFDLGENGVVQMDIPLDPAESRNIIKQALKQAIQALQAIRRPLLIVGSILTILNLSYALSFVNILFLLYYCWLWYFEIKLSRQRRHILTVINREGKPLQSAVVRLLGQDGGVALTKATDPKGKVFILAPKGTYTLQIISPATSELPAQIFKQALDLPEGILEKPYTVRVN